MSNKEQESRLNIDVNITNLVLTPITCSTLVSKVIKCLIYEKSQIPYPYEWLQSVVNKKRKLDSETESDNSKNYQAERHFRVVSSAYDTTESILKEIKQQFKSGSPIEEILLLFGGSEMSPKEVYRIRIPYLAKGHLEENHYTLTNKFSHSVLRQIFFSPEWMTAVDNTLPLTNMFLFVKTSGGNIESECLEPNSSFYLTKRTLIVNINLIYKNDYSHNCCRNLKVYEDGKEEPQIMNNVSENIVENDEDSDCDWYKANLVLKGFKEGFVNKIPLSQLW